VVDAHCFISFDKQKEKTANRNHLVCPLLSSALPINTPTPTMKPPYPTSTSAAVEGGYRQPSLESINQFLALGMGQLSLGPFHFC